MCFLTDFANQRPNDWGEFEGGVSDSILQEFLGEAVIKGYLKCSAIAVCRSELLPLTKTTAREPSPDSDSSRGSRHSNSGFWGLPLVGPPDPRKSVRGASCCGIVMMPPLEDTTARGPTSRLPSLGYTCLTRNALLRDGEKRPPCSDNALPGAL